MIKKVLIVDDSMVSRMMIKEIILSQHATWECRQAASAEKAIAACRDVQFDFITLGLNSPEQAELEVAPDILSSQSDARVALLSANQQATQRTKRHYKELVVLSKPINADEILAFVAA